MTTHMTVQADVVLNLTEWSREEVEHASAEAAWDAYYEDLQTLVGREVYITSVENGWCATMKGWCAAIEYDRPVKARVVEMAGDEVNMNYDEEWVYIDPYVGVAVLEDDVPHGAGFVIGRTHKWRNGE